MVVNIARTKNLGNQRSSTADISVQPVSYTHLDVYKRQGEKHPGRGVKQYLKPCAHEQSEQLSVVTACLL